MSRFVAILDDGDLALCDTKEEADLAVSSSESGKGIVVESLRLFYIDEDSEDPTISTEAVL